MSADDEAAEVAVAADAGRPDPAAPDPVSAVEPARPSAPARALRAVRAARAGGVARIGAWLAAGASAYTLVAIHAGWVRPWPVVVFEALFPFVVVGTVVLALGALLARAWVLAAVAAVVAVLGALLVVPLARPAAVPAWVDGAPGLRVASANLLFESSRHAEALAALDATGADVIVLIEVTGAWASAIASSPVTNHYPYQVIVPARGGNGRAILSKRPITQKDSITRGRGAGPVVELIVGGAPLTLVLAHPESPDRPESAARWARELKAVAAALANPRGTVVIVGDFNSTYWHPPLRRLLAAGYRDGHATRGRGLTMSWPAKGFPVRLIRLDHVLVSPDAYVAAVRDIAIPGSDHTGFVADVAVHR